MLRDLASIWRPLTTDVPQESISGPDLFNIFINGLVDGSEHILSEFTDDIKLGRMAVIAEFHAAIQRDMDKLEKSVDRNLINFNKAKCKVLDLVGKNLKGQYMLGATQVGSSLAEKDLGLPVYTKSGLHWMKYLPSD